MLVIVLLLIIIAISLTYFNQNALESIRSQSLGNDMMLDSTSNISAYTDSSFTALWKRLTIILLICTLPLIWEGRTFEDVYLYNGLLLSTNGLNITVWLLFISGITFISIISLKDNLTHSSTTSTNIERIIFILCAILGGIILSCATDFLTILLGLELQSYSVYILAASYRNYEPSEAAGLKYFLLGALSSALVFMGLAILYTYSGSTNLYHSLFIINSTDYNNNDILHYVGVILIFAGICWKVAAAPVQAWSIDVYDAVPTRTTAILSLIPKIALFSLLIRLISMLISNNHYVPTLQIIILIISLSLIVGAVAGLSQPRIKRLLAYSSVLNVGFILMSALLSNSIVDYSTTIFYIIQYIITTATIWLCLINLANILNKNDTDITLISQLQGIHTNIYKNYNNNIIAICLTALILSVAGIPPMVGFFAKYSVILLAVQSGYISLALLAVTTSIISTVYYLGIIKTIWSKSSIINPNINIPSMSTPNNSKVESTLFISLGSLIIVLFFLQYSVVFTFINL